MRRFLSAVLLAASLVGCAAGGARTGAVPPAAPARVSADRAAVRAHLAARRAQVFERFLAYREGRVYPQGDGTGGFQHVWIDRNGNLCAAATLISQDLGRDGAIRAVEGNNGIALAGVTDGALADWILTSGLTHHEVVAIQVPGFDPGPEPVQAPRFTETERLYGIYVDVERQLRGLWDESLDAATDALMARPALAHAVLARTPAPQIAFAQPPPR